MVSHLCSCRAWLMLTFDTTSPYTSTKSERTRDLASTSLSTSPNDRNISEVMMWTVFGELGRHHLDFLWHTETCQNLSLTVCTVEGDHTCCVTLTAGAPWFYWPTSSRTQRFPAPQWKWGTPGCSRSLQRYPAAAKPVSVTDVKVETKYMKRRGLKETSTAAHAMDSKCLAVLQRMHHCSCHCLQHGHLLASVSRSVHLARCVPSAGLWSPGKTSGWSCQRLKQLAVAAPLPPGHQLLFYLKAQSLNGSVSPLYSPCLTLKC